MSRREVGRRRDAALGAGAPLFYEEPVQLVRGEGVYLFDEDGRRYLDVYNNVPCVGHGNAAVATAVGRQQATLNVHSRYLHEGIVELAERLIGLYPQGIDQVVFTCSGTEANEVALRAARMFTGHTGIVCSDATYHGNSELVGSLTHVPVTRAGDTVRSFPFPDRSRPLDGGGPGSRTGDNCLAALAQAIEALQASPGGFAALIVCSIFANEGLPEIPPGFMERAAELARAAGGLVIADEVQAGYGRTGRWWGFETSGFVPDMVVTGKPMGNGIPLAAVAGGRDVIDLFRRKSRYFNTFAASPGQAAAGLAVLAEIDRMALVEQSAQVGARLKAELTHRAATLAPVGAVRGHGLFVGVELVAEDGSPDPRFARRLVNALRDQGVLAGAAGASGNVLKIRPPLVFNDTHSDLLLAQFDQAMGNLLTP